jgi:GT2 family glycosyltransferase
LIVVYHLNHKISEVITGNDQKIQFDTGDTIAAGLYRLAQQFPDKKIVWCRSDAKEYLNLEAIPVFFHHHKMMFSYFPENGTFFGCKIGYVEETPFINVNKKVSYPTWQMSNSVGVIHASVLNEVKEKVKPDADLDYFLSSLAKLCMPLGLLCYSEPKLLKKSKVMVTHQATLWTLFRFVGQHYKTRWVFLLLFSLIVYERQFPLFPFLFSFFYKKRNTIRISLDNIVVLSSLKVINEATIDVIIPTIGRKEYLYAVLCDLRNQTHLPKNVIIVEQNPLVNTVSELDYITNEEWPFVIKHTFTHQAGACNARNIALKKVESEWVFLNDDDNRFESDLIEKVFLNIKKYGTLVLMTSYLQSNEKLNYTTISQTTIFGSGNSFLRSILLENVAFNMSMEFGYGEDADFGLQLRNYGTDIIYFPEPGILHLKAPMGGFRIKPILAWSHEEIQPKPSPTLMLLKHAYDTKEQTLGYKLVLFLKLFKKKGWRSPLQFISLFKKQWTASRYWANQLEKND